MEPTSRGCEKLISTADDLRYARGVGYDERHARRRRLERRVSEALGKARNGDAIGRTNDLRQRLERKGRFEHDARIGPAL